MLVSRWRRSLPSHTSAVQANVSAALAVEGALGARQLEAEARGLVRQRLARAPMIVGARELALVGADDLLRSGLPAMGHVRGDRRTKRAARLRAGVDAAGREAPDLPHEAGGARVLRLVVLLSCQLLGLHLQGLQGAPRGIVAGRCSASVVVKQGAVDLSVADRRRLHVRAEAQSRQRKHDQLPQRHPADESTICGKRGSAVATARQSPQSRVSSSAEAWHTES
mmetsp:Transcript_99292/g.286505  ORF Transcript_99292/g.286505 Transcript_99292/m.286505 type:complete len:224 (+) Transcript_99292:54-725(+)